MGKLKKYDSATDTWTTIATGGGGSSGGGGGSGGGSFDTNAYYTLSADQAVTAGGYRKILFDTVVFDGNTEWDAVNLYWKCKETGYYNISISAAPLYLYTAVFRVTLYLDGVGIFYGSPINGISGFFSTSTIDIPNMAITADSYLEVYVYTTVNTSVENDPLATWFRVTRYK
jgi:hypothetical protein